jgi:hypothetical protein
MFATPVAAQSGKAPATEAEPYSRTTGISVTVLDPTGKAVKDVAVLVKTVDGNEVGKGVSGGDGKFELLNMRPGHYLVYFEMRDVIFPPQPERVLVKRGKITEFRQRATAPFVGEIIAKKIRTREIKPKR